MANKISVIIPAFNAERTIERTVRSVLASTIPLDIYVVNDGSTDNTQKILEKLSTHSPYSTQLKIINQENNGAYNARLTALKQITTPYFGFVDADDTIEPTMFEKMLAFAEANNLDVVQCGSTGGEAYEREGILEDRAAVEREFIKPHLIEGRGSSFIWNKLYRNQYDFSTFVAPPKFTNFDDMIFNFQFFAKVQRMGYMKEKLYHYAATEGSVTHNYGERQFNDLCACAKLRRQFGAKNLRWPIINVRSAAIVVLRSGMTFGEKVGWLFKLIKFLAVEIGRTCR